MNVDVVKAYLTSPHKVVRCTIQLQTCEQRIEQLKVPKKLLEGCGGKASDEYKDSRQNWDI